MTDRVTNKLMIKDAEYFANKMAKKMDYVHHEVSNDDGSSTSCDMESILRQLADTMRENERLLEGFKRIHAVTLEHFIETEIEEILGYNPNPHSDKPNKESDNDIR